MSVRGVRGFFSPFCVSSHNCQDARVQGPGRMSSRISVVLFFGFFGGVDFPGQGRGGLCNREPIKGDRGRWGDRFGRQVVFLGCPVQVLGCLGWIGLLGNSNRPRDKRDTTATKEINTPLWLWPVALVLTLHFHSLSHLSKAQ